MYIPWNALIEVSKTVIRIIVFGEVERQVMGSRAMVTMGVTSIGLT